MVAYNVPGVGPGIQLTPAVIADIFLGKITKWNDPAITKLNRGTNFPATTIAPVHRSDGSGTTNIFTTFLAETSGEWASSVGAGKSVHWPNGLGGKGNQGVAQLIKTNEGGIGYIELNYAVTNSISLRRCPQRARARASTPPSRARRWRWTPCRCPPTSARSPSTRRAANGYPITGFTYLLVYRNGTKPEVKKMLQWMLTTGQKDAGPMYYAPLPPGVRQRALAAVASIR